jgi:spermidine synthase
LSWIGSQALVAWLGTVQVVLGLLWLWSGQPTRRLMLLVAGLGSSLALGALALHPIQKLNAPVYQEDSPYQQVRIRDDQLFRYLVLDRTFHAVMWKSDPVALFLPYSQLMVASLALVPEAQHGLILGHGGGSLAKWLAHYWPSLELDVVEFDPVVVRMAQDYFGYQAPPNHHVFVKDGRAFLNATNQSYDVIWIDAFARHMIPFHLTTVEFFSAVRAHLNPGGIVAVNLASSGEGGDTSRAEAVVQTMKRSFPAVETFAVKGPWKSPQTKAENLIFFAGWPIEQGSFERFSAKVAEMAMNQQLPREALALLGSHRKEPWARGFELTDDFAPYDLLIGRDVVQVRTD